MPSPNVWIDSNVVKNGNHNEGPSVRKPSIFRTRTEDAIAAVK